MMIALFFILGIIGFILNHIYQIKKEKKDKAKIIMDTINLSKQKIIQNIEDDDYGSLSSLFENEYIIYLFWLDNNKKLTTNVVNGKTHKNITKKEYYNILKHTELKKGAYLKTTLEFAVIYYPLIINSNIHILAVEL